MVRMVMVYYWPEGEEEFFDEDQYHNFYVPGAIKVAEQYNCRGFVLGRTIANRNGGQGGTGIYRTTEIAFDTLEEAVAFVLSPERTALGEAAKLEPHYKLRSEVFYTDDEVYEFVDGKCVSGSGPGADQTMKALGRS